MDTKVEIRYLSQIVLLNIDTIMVLRSRLSNARYHYQQGVL